MNFIRISNEMVKRRLAALSMMEPNNNNLLPWFSTCCSSAWKSLDFESMIASFIFLISSWLSFSCTSISSFSFLLWNNLLHARFVQLQGLQGIFPDHFSSYHWVVEKGLWGQAKYITNTLSSKICDMNKRK